MTSCSIRTHVANAGSDPTLFMMYNILFTDLGYGTVLFLRQLLRSLKSEDMWKKATREGQEMGVTMESEEDRKERKRFCLE